MATLEESSFNDRGYHPEISQGEVVVHPNSWGEVSALPAQSKSIATFKLMGCIGLGLIITKADGSKIAYIQHYSPDQVPESIDALKDVTKRHKVPDGGHVKGVIMAPLVSSALNPGTQIAHSETVQFLISEAYDGFHSSLKANLSIDIRIFPYSPNECSESYDGSLLIDLGETGIGTIYAESVPVLSSTN